MGLRPCQWEAVQGIEAVKYLSDLSYLGCIIRIGFIQSFDFQ